MNSNHFFWSHSCCHFLRIQRLRALQGWRTSRNPRSPWTTAERKESRSSFWASLAGNIEGSKDISLRNPKRGKTSENLISGKAMMVASKMLDPVLQSKMVLARTRIMRRRRIMGTRRKWIGKLFNATIARKMGSQHTFPMYFMHPRWRITCSDLGNCFRVVTLCPWKEMGWKCLIAEDN